MIQMNQVQQRKTNHLNRFFQHQKLAVVVDVRIMNRAVQCKTAHQREHHQNG